MEAFKSEAQRRKWKELVEQGKVTQAEYDLRETVTPASIPERIHPKKVKK
jgi:hypothetical protein